MPNNSQQAAAATAFAESPFQIEHFPSAEAAAATAAKSKKRKRTSGPVAQPQSPAVQHQKAILPLAGKFKNGQELDRHFAVSPARQWADAKRYKSFRLNEMSYTSGQFVYVANPDTIETQRNQGVRIPTDEWVAKILEIRAVNEQNVFARVAWMYWPQELPKNTWDRGKRIEGRQPYHGRHELIASNHMDIIHATTVTEHAKVDQWIDTEQDAVLDALYWRQGLDTRTLELSSVPLTCRCQTPPNPDLILVGCTNKQCNQWLHKECLEDDILMKTWERKGLETLDTTAIKEEVSTNGDIKMEPSATPETHSNGVKKESGSARSTPHRGTSSTPLRATPLGRAGSVKAKGKKAPVRKPYEGKYEATLNIDDGGLVTFELKDIRAGVPEADRQWTENVYCLVCDSVIE